MDRLSKEGFGFEMAEGKHAPGLVIWLPLP